MRRYIRSVRLVFTAFVGAVVCSLAAEAAEPPIPRGFERISHIIVIYLENHSFDNLFGLFPGADNLYRAGKAPPQSDRSGRVYEFLPPVMRTADKPPTPDPRFAPQLPNLPFWIDQYVKPSDKVPDLVHRYYQQIEQINGGRMDRFAAVSDAGGLVMGFHDYRGTRLWDYARRYTLADNFFQAAFGGSFLNHIWLVCACTPRHNNVGEDNKDMRAVLAADGKITKDGQLTPDDYAVNTIQPFYRPYNANATDPKRRLTPQTLPTIGERLSEKGVSWAWYSGGWNDAMAGKPDRTFQFHHQAFVYFEKYADGTPEKARHLLDEADFIAAIERGTLPQVSFYKPVGHENQHPGYADISSGDKRIGDILAAIERSPIWPGAAIIVTYDENGGYWDHVAPPKIDRWGPGARVPAIIVSPFARRGHVDHTVYDTTSILKLIELRFGLAPLTERDKNANGLLNAFNFKPAR